MRRLFNVFFVLSFANQAWASPNNIQSLYYAQRVSMALTDVIAGNYVIEISGYSKEDREQIALFSELNTSKLHITAKDNVLVINHANQAAAVIEFTSDGIYLNGAELKINPDVSLTQNLRNWAIKKKQNSTTSNLKRLWQYLNPSAFAADPLETGKQVVKALGAAALDNLDTYATMVVTYAKSSSIAAGGAGAGAVTITTGTALAVTAAAIIAGMAVLGIVACEQEAIANSAHANTSKMRERLNCYSKPLTWINLNPRDRFHAQNITCSRDNNSMVLDFESQMHHEAKVELIFENGNLKKIAPSAVGSKMTADFLQSKEMKQLKEAVSKQAKYFQQICKNPNVLKTFRAAVATQKKQGKIFTGEIPTRNRTQSPGNQ